MKEGAADGGIAGETIPVGIVSILNRPGKEGGKALAPQSARSGQKRPDWPGGGRFIRIHKIPSGVRRRRAR
jgi:hypothetical protein